MGTGFGRAQFWLLVVILAFTALLAIGSSSGGSQSTAASAKGASAKASTHPEMPLAYFGQQYSRITESPHRKEKDARRSGFLRRELRDPGRPGAPRVVESELVIDTLGGHEPLPFATSTAVVIGTIESGSGFVASNNRTAYSEYTILVHRVLMQDAVLRIEPSNTVIGTRTGASVVFPSGSVVHLFVHGRGMPKPGRSYVFFLWRATDVLEHDYGIVTAYDVTDGFVHALDSEPEYEKFNKVALTDFLRILESTIAAGQGGRQ